MLSESRVKLMTKMAAFEAYDGKKSMAIGTYFRGDYIGKEVIKSVIYGTVAFCLLFAVYIAYNAETLLAGVYDMDILGFAKKVMFDYLVFVVGYSVVTYVVYVVRYRKARREIRSYYNNLRRLGMMYRKGRGRSAKEETEKKSGKNAANGKNTGSFASKKRERRE